MAREGQNHGAEIVRRASGALTALLVQNIFQFANGVPCQVVLTHHRGADDGNLGIGVGIHGRYLDRIADTDEFDEVALVVLIRPPRA